MNVFFLCFIFEEVSSSIPMLLVMLFAHGGKHSNSRSQMFFKTGFLTNFAIFACSLRPAHYAFPKFYLMIGNLYFRVITTVKLGERTLRSIDQISSEEMVFCQTTWIFLLQWFFFFFFFFCYLIISLLRRFIGSSNCCKGEATSLTLNNLGFTF